MVLAAQVTDVLERRFYLLHELAVSVRIVVILRSHRKGVQRVGDHLDHRLAVTQARSQKHLLLLLGRQLPHVLDGRANRVDHLRFVGFDLRPDHEFEVCVDVEQSSKKSSSES